MTRLSLGLCLIALAGVSCAGAPSDGLYKLSVKSCKPVGSSEFIDKLSADWKPYLSATKICPLLPAHQSKPNVVLISVFAEDYYRDKPADAPWENFPKPIFLNRDGECVGRLTELFPVDQPRELSVRYGRWKGDIPGEVHIHVHNPAVGGDYDLPVLTWDNTLRQYVTSLSIEKSLKEQMTCPTHLLRQ